VTFSSLILAASQNPKKLLHVKKPHISGKYERIKFSTPFVPKVLATKRFQQSTPSSVEGVPSRGEIRKPKHQHLNHFSECLASLHGKKNNCRGTAEAQKIYPESFQRSNKNVSICALYL